MTQWIDILGHSLAPCSEPPFSLIAPLSSGEGVGKGADWASPSARASSFETRYRRTLPDVSADFDSVDNWPNWHSAECVASVSLHRHDRLFSLSRSSAEHTTVAVSNRAIESSTLVPGE